MAHSQQDRPGEGLRVAIVQARFNAEVTDRLARGAKARLARLGVAAPDVEHVTVPGAFELPLAARAAALGGRFDAVVALGAVIRGETDHYRLVCDAATHGLLRVTLDTGVPVGFGVLTCDSDEQAMARAGAGKDDDDDANKGAEAAAVAIEMVHRTRNLIGR
jgi:6,7-dimethyl-8-ribityllumazine synthase